jgi:HD-like signal output (HDOD) protein
VVLQKNGRSTSDSSFSPADDEKMYGARDRLLQKLGVAGDLPTLGSSVTRVVQLTSSNDEAVRELAHIILSDVALTQTILRISNTVVYRSSSGSPVTTVSKAILILGFDTIKTSALGMLLVDGMSGRHAHIVRTELAHALGASIIGRELARRSQFKDAEEAAVASLFKNIGRVIVAAHEPELYTRIGALVDSGSHTPLQASMQVLGCSLDLLGKAVLQQWNIPDTIVQAIPPLPMGVLRSPKSRQEWLQQVAAFSAAATKLLANLDGPEHEEAAELLLKRFGAALHLDREKLDDLLRLAASELQVFSDHSSLADDYELMADAPAAMPAETPAAPQAAQADADAEAGANASLLNDLRLETFEIAHSLQVTARHPSGKPRNARDLLLAGMQDVTQMMAGGKVRVNDLMLLALETLYSSLGFRFATVCLKDAQTGQFRARIAMGHNGAERKATFVFSPSSSHDLFSLALEQDVDLMIFDATVPKVRDLLPQWHRSLLPDSRSFMVLPLVVNKRQIGLFYADRDVPAPEGMPPDETALVKTLKAQVLAALNVR